MNRGIFRDTFLNGSENRVITFKPRSVKRGTFSKWSENRVSIYALGQRIGVPF